MRVTTIIHGDAHTDINVDAFVDALYEVRNRAERLGAIAPTTRSEDAKAQRRELQGILNQALHRLEEEVMPGLLSQAFELGMRHAKLSDGKAYHCKVCLAGYDTVNELFTHAEQSTDPECLRALQQALAQTVR